jgi:hypothetical protein
MSLTARVLLIVFGSLAALLILAVSLAVYAGYRMANSASDPATIKRVAADFGTFDVPPHYRETMAMDLAFSKTLFIGPAGPTKNRGRFAIILGRTAMPQIGATAPALPSNLLTNDTAPMKIPGCKQSTPAMPELIRSKVGTITLRRTVCEDGTLHTELASAYFMSHGGLIFVSASGPKASFDLAALRSLLASFR